LQQFRAVDKEESITQGIAQGLTQGLTQGEAPALLTLLSSRFGQVTAEL
jgi:flagellar biosynthesis/type III secretory pathway protein FliH